MGRCLLGLGRRGKFGFGLGLGAELEEVVWRGAFKESGSGST